MRLDIAALAIACVLAISILLYVYTRGLMGMRNYNLRAWVKAEKTASEWTDGRLRGVDGLEVRVVDVISGSVVYQAGSCRVRLGHAYTFRIANDTLYKVEVWYCKPP